jgi:hypothetical protein
VCAAGLGNLFLHLPAGTGHGQLSRPQSLLGLVTQQLQLRGTQITKRSRKRVRFYIYFCSYLLILIANQCRVSGNQRGFQTGGRFAEDPHHRQSHSNAGQFEFI